MSKTKEQPFREQLRILIFGGELQTMDLGDQSRRRRDQDQVLDAVESGLKTISYLDGEFRRGAEAAASIADSYNSSSTHDYLLGDCILHKINLRAEPPRRNLVRKPLECKKAREELRKLDAAFTALSVLRVDADANKNQKWSLTMQYIDELARAREGELVALLKNK